MIPAIPHTSGEHLQVLLALPIGDRRQVALPLVALVVHEHVVEPSRHRSADDLIKSAMPGRLYHVFKHYKRDEWERYLAAVTDWERDEYLEVLP